jgi:choline transporter-like protein 2/4/5
LTIKYVDGQQKREVDLTLDTVKSGVKYIMDLLQLKRTFEYAYEDFDKSLWLICSGLILGCFVSFTWILLLRFIIKPLFVFSVGIVMGLLGFGVYFCIDCYIKLRNGNAPSFADSDFSLSIEKLFDLTYLKSLQDTWLVLGIFMGLVFLVLLLVLVFLRKRIRLSIELIRESSKAIVNMPSCLFWPIIPFVMQVGVIIYCVLTALYLASAGIALYKVTFDNGTQQQAPSSDGYHGLVAQVGDLCEPQVFNKLYANTSYTCVFYKYGYNKTYPGFFKTDNIITRTYSSFFVFLDDHQWLPQAYVAFMFFWLTSFVVGLSEMTLAGAFGQWYWTRFSNYNSNMSNKRLRFPLAVAFNRSIVFHMGMWLLKFKTDTIDCAIGFGFLK